MKSRSQKIFRIVGMTGAPAPTPAPTPNPTPTITPARESSFSRENDDEHSSSRDEIYSGWRHRNSWHNHWEEHKSWKRYWQPNIDHNYTDSKHLDDKPRIDD